MAKLVLMLRIKDGIYFLKDWLERYEDIADEIVVLDNGSTDGTVELLQAHHKVVDIVYTADFNEGRDKNLLYNHVRMRKPDWCLWLDADEFFEPAFNRAALDKMMASKVYDRYAFRRFHFIDREYFAGSPYWLNYSAGHDRILWREKPSGYFADLLIDSPNVKGIGGLKVYTSFRIKHLGYINKALVDKKAELYRKVLTGGKDIISTMYLANEKKVLWIDNPVDKRVKSLNTVLNILLLKQFYKKGAVLISGRIKSLFERSKNNAFLGLKTNGGNG